MAIPDLKRANHTKAAAGDHFTVGCVSCKRPLWKVEKLGTYGSNDKWITRETPVSDAIKPYRDVFIKTATGYDIPDTKCPYCRNDFIKAVHVKGSDPVCVPYVLEFG